jgi:hypothetical protein
MISGGSGVLTPISGMLKQGADEQNFRPRRDDAPGPPDLDNTLVMRGRPFRPGTSGSPARRETALSQRLLPDAA